MGNRFYEGETEPREKESLVLETKAHREGTRVKRIQRKFMFSCIPVTDVGRLRDFIVTGYHGYTSLLSPVVATAANKSLYLPSLSP